MMVEVNEQDTKMEGGSIQMRLLYPDIAVAHCVGSVKLRWQKKAPKKKAIGKLQLFTIAASNRRILFRMVYEVTEFKMT